MEEGKASHRAQGVDVWSLQSYGDAVEEDEDQHHVVKHFVGNDLLACGSEPGERWEEQNLWNFGSGMGSSFPKPFCCTSPGSAMIVINY